MEWEREKEEERGVFSICVDCVKIQIKSLKDNTIQREREKEERKGGKQKKREKKKREKR